MSDVDEIALEAARKIYSINTGRAVGGKRQYVAMIQCAVRDAIEQYARAQGADPVAEGSPLPCPFCGSRDVGGTSGVVSCYRCNAQIEVQNTNTAYAVELWNQRAYTQQQSAGVPDSIDWREQNAERVVRAFWRRIYPYRNDYDKELPKELPVEFAVHMATALCALDLSTATTPQADGWKPAHGMSEELPEIGKPVMGYHPDWVDEDFCADGIRECFLFGDGSEWQSARWDGYSDQWIVEDGAPQLWQEHPQPPREQEGE